MRIILTNVAPGAVVLVTIGGMLLFAPGAPVLAQAGQGYPYAVLAATLLLAWRFQRSRVAIAALALGMVSMPFEPWAFGGDALTRTLQATLLPPGLALLALTADRSLTAPRMPIQLAFVFAPFVAGAAWLGVERERVGAMLMHEWIDASYMAWSPLPQPALLAALLGIAALTAAAWQTRRAVDAGLAWATLTLVLALAAPVGSLAAGLWSLAGAALLVTALVESSYVMAFHDELTELPGRRALNQTLASVRSPYTVAIIDVDRFKSFNDRYGHDVGDQVLRMVAARLAAVGGGGRAFRSGGEEFTIVFSGKPRDQALRYLEAVRVAVAGDRFTIRTLPRPRRDGSKRRGTRRGGEREIGVTVSIGLASPGASHSTVAAVLKAADKAMYRAKQSGRNRVVAVR